MLSSLVLATALAVAPESFVIAVGNNNSPKLGRPQLKYADDDAARAVETFLSATGTRHVELLTTMDDDSARLHAGLLAQAKPATRAEVGAAFTRLADWGKERRAAGVRTRGYFIFAGHGDVEQGEGFIELEDGPLRASDFEALLARAGVDELHVVLDSCNSWFVLNPRKAGSRLFPTPKEATEALRARLPNVGVLLSTSAESETYEWSELQSGIFSYAFRSGLVGGADVNVDGEVSYEELAAFIDVATRAIKNPAFRPRIFARGPGGATASPFASSDGSDATVLTGTSTEPLRLRFRDGDGVRLYDVNVGANTKLTVRLPRREGLVLERKEVLGWRAFQLPQGGSVELSSVVTPAAHVQGRSANELLTSFFDVAFSSSDVETWKARELAEATMVPLGVSEQLVDRVGLALKTAADQERGTRMTILLVSAAALATGIGLNIGYLFSNQSGRARFQGLEVFGWFLGLNGLTQGLLALVPSVWESQAIEFARQVEAGKSADAIHALERFAEKQQRDAKRSRIVAGAGGGALLAAGAVGLAWSFVDGQDRQSPSSFNLLLIATSSVIIGALFIGSTFALGTSETFAQLLRQERAPAPPKLGLTTVPGGAGLSLSGQF